MAALVEIVARQAQSTFAKSLTDETFSDCLTKLARSVGQLKAKDVNLNREVLSDYSFKRSRAPVTYIEVMENPKFSMGIFVLRHGARIPLHDHPGMHGVLKVIQGTVKIFSYSALPRQSSNCPIPTDISRKLKHSEVKALVPVEKHDVLDITENDEPCILSPTKGNFHEILAVSGPAAFIDILAPPYDMKERDCHYYLPFETNTPESDVRTWLLKTVPPADFWCDSAPYRGPTVDF